MTSWRPSHILPAMLKRFCGLVSIFALLALAPQQGWAQEGHAIGPFRLGMSARDFQTIASEPAHQLPGASEVLSSDQVAATTVWRGAPVIVIASYTQDVVHTLNVSLTPRDLTPQACQIFHTEIARDLAAQFGPLNKLPVAQAFAVGPGDPESESTPTAQFEPVTRELADGTLIAIYRVDQTRTQIITSERTGSPNVDLSTWHQPDERGELECETSVTIWDQTLRAAAHGVANAASPPRATQSEEVRAALAPRIASAERLASPSFTQTPAEPIWRVYPPDAVFQRQEGDVVADCLINADGSLDCLIVSEEPLGWGFGSAALQIFSEYRVDVSNGAAGRYVRMRMPFRYT